MAKKKINESQNCYDYNYYYKYHHFFAADLKCLHGQRLNNTARVDTAKQKRFEATTMTKG
jgi:hypothetical protein